MYEIVISTSLARTLESLGNPLQFGSLYNLGKWTYVKSESKSKRHVIKCVLEFQQKGDYNVPWVSFRIAIVSKPLLQ